MFELFLLMECVIDSLIVVFIGKSDRRSAKLKGQRGFTGLHDGVVCTLLCLR